MKRRVFLALGLALPLELVNFFLLMPPLDVGYPPGTSWWIQSIGLVWILLHWIGLKASYLLQETRYAILSVPAIFAGGYLEIAVLLIFVLSTRPLIRILRRKRISTDQ